MKRFLQWLVLAPVAVLGIAFAVANRQAVDISFDPFAAAPAPQMGLQVPLFLVMFVALAVGVLLGGSFTWWAQGRHRRALRDARSDVARLRGTSHLKV